MFRNHEEQIWLKKERNRLNPSFCGRACSTGWLSFDLIDAIAKPGGKASPFGSDLVREEGHLRNTPQNSKRIPSQCSYTVTAWPQPRAIKLNLKRVGKFISEKQQNLELGTYSGSRNWGSILQAQLLKVEVWILDCCGLLQCIYFSSHFLKHPKTVQSFVIAPMSCSRTERRCLCFVCQNYCKGPFSIGRMWDDDRLDSNGIQMVEFCGWDGWSCNGISIPSVIIRAINSLF